MGQATPETDLPEPSESAGAATDANSGAAPSGAVSSGAAGPSVPPASSAPSAAPAPSAEFEQKTTDSLTIASPLMLPEGAVIAGYRVEERLGGGVLSSVYRAAELATGRLVAVKVLTPGADEVATSRFRQEARMAATLDHPHIVHTLQVGQTGETGGTGGPSGGNGSVGIAYIVMELVQGESLGDLLERFRQLSVIDTCNVLEPIARALAYAHAQGIVHRDVKPSNILLRPVADGEEGGVRLSVLDRPVAPLLSDFGIARAIDSPELTSAGRTIGTPAFMAPEQCAGQQDIDGRADIYALGAVFYRCLVGRPPFVGTTTQILYAHVYSPLTIPDEVLVRLPLRVVDILRNALMKEPRQRYPSAEMMADDMALAAGRRILRVTPADMAGAFDSTETMDSLPVAAAPRSSTVLIPAAVRVTPQARPTPLSQPRVPRAPGPPAARPPRRSGPWFALPLALGMALLVAVAGYVALRALAPAFDPTGPAPAATSASALETAQATADGVAVQATLERSTPAPTATPAFGPAPPVSFIVAQSAWGDAQYFHGDRDWRGTLDQLTMLLRTDSDFNARLGRQGEGTGALIRELFLEAGDDAPFWRRFDPLIDRQTLEQTAFDAFVGLAAEASAAGKPEEAAAHLRNALALRPGSAALNDLLRRTETYTAAAAGERQQAQAALAASHRDYAVNLFADERVCDAAEQLAAADALLPNAANGELLEQARTLCDEAQAAGEVDPAQLSGSLLYSTVHEGHDRIFSAAMAPGGSPSLVIEDGAQPAFFAGQDGARLAFYSTVRGSEGLVGFDLYRGLGPAERSRDYPGHTEDSRYAPPSWSPTGDRLVFASERAGDRRSRLFLIAADARSEAVELGFGKDPAWRPRQEMIAYSGADRTGNRPGLWLMTSAGNEVQRLTDRQGDSRPVWTPDGSALIFMSEERSGNWDLYRLDVEEDAVAQLTDDPGQDMLPAVSPDGSYVVFLSDREGSWSFWVMSSQGGEAQRLAQPLGSLPQWTEHALQWIP